jgi:hypothetical protein
VRDERLLLYCMHMNDAFVQVCTRLIWITANVYLYGFTDHIYIYIYIYQKYGVCMSHVEQKDCT